MLKKCKLCDQDKELRKSHSIPRTFFAGIKEDGKCIIFEDKKAELKGNFDPKEFMLCGDCESFLSKEYEAYGTHVLRGYKDVKKYDDCVVFKNFKYERFYLYLISILWRASVAEDKHYTLVELGHGLEDFLRHSILRKKIKINDKSSLKLDHFIKISVYRMVDSTGNVSDAVIKNILSNIGIYPQTKNTNIKSITYFWLCDGFLIFYHLLLANDIHQTRALRFDSQLKKGSHQKISKIEISSEINLVNIFNGLIIASKERT